MPLSRSQYARRSCPTARSTDGIRDMPRTWSSRRLEAYRPVSRPIEAIEVWPEAKMACTPPWDTHRAVTTRRLTHTARATVSEAPLVEWRLLPGVRGTGGAAGRVVCRTSRSSIAVMASPAAVSYTHLRAHETRHDLVCRL